MIDARRKEKRQVGEGNNQLAAPVDSPVNNRTRPDVTQLLPIERFVARQAGLAGCFKMKSKHGVLLNLYMAGEAVPVHPSCVLAFVQQRGQNCNGYDWTTARYSRLRRKHEWRFYDHEVDASRKRITVVFWIDLPAAGLLLTCCKVQVPSKLRREISSTFEQSNICSPTPEDRQSSSLLLASLIEDGRKLRAFGNLSLCLRRDHPQKSCVSLPRLPAGS
jgi:hypothetical protein